MKTLVNLSSLFTHDTTVFKNTYHCYKVFYYYYTNLLNITKSLKSLNKVKI